MKRSLFFLLSLFALSAAGQECNCSKTLDSVRTYIERNYAGFGDKVTKTNRAAYKEYNKRYKKIAKGVNDVVHCASIIDEWTDFFDDNHLYLIYSPGKTTENLKSYQKTVGKFSVTTEQLKQIQENNDPLSIEGVYGKIDSSYRIAVLKHPSLLYDYVGVILNTKKPLWQTNEIKFELKKQKNGLYKITMYDDNHVASFDRFNIEEPNALAFYGWIKERVTAAPRVVKNKTFSPFEQDEKTKVFFKRLDATTGYVRIKSFDVGLYKKIDSLFKIHKAEIGSIPNLIIDIRGNGGGGDISYRPIKKLLYTQPIQMIGLDFLATNENLASYIKAIKAAGLPEKDEKVYLEQAESARRSKKRYFNFFSDYVDTLDAVLASPKKVAVIIDQKVGSTAEQFLLEARQSKKVKIYGAPSMGVLDYANVCEMDYPGISAALHYPTTRSRRIDMGLGIDNKGVKPDVQLDFTSSDWLKEVLIDLNK